MQNVKGWTSRHMESVPTIIDFHFGGGVFVPLFVGPAPS